MKQREIFVRVERSKQRDVCGLYFVQSRLAQGFVGLPSARAVPGAADSRTASATAAQAIVLRAARRSAAVLVECIDVHLRVRRAVDDAFCVGTSPFVVGGGVRARLSGPLRPLAGR